MTLFTERKPLLMKKQEQHGDLPKLSAPAHRALAGANITNLQQVSAHSETEITKLHGVGPNAIKELREALAAKGLTFRDVKG